MRLVLEQLGMEIVADMTRTGNLSLAAVCDGGDVLFTGRHLFVGLSSRTNQAACRVLHQAFADVVETIPVVMPQSQVLHLKSAVTHLDDSTLLAPTGALGDGLLQSMKAEERGYTVIRIPHVLTCNAVVVNNHHVLAQDSSCEVSKQALRLAATERNMMIDFVDTSELAKKDAALTCCSVLLEI
jgi:dimethylargininase